MPVGPAVRMSLVLGFVALATALGPGCGSVESQGNAGGSPCKGIACAQGDGGPKDSGVSDVPQPDAEQDAGIPTVNPLCGVGCLPDELAACPDPSASSGGAAADADQTDAGTADAGPDPDAGATSDAPTSAPGMGCYVTRNEGKPVPQCQPAGTGEPGSPCVSSGGCAAGLACVGEGSAAQCRPYCCGDPSACEKGTYCAERPLKEEGLDAGTTPLSVPVCVAADDCKLDEPYPCAAGASCKCKDGTACMVVKDDGTTSCVAPGEGRAGDSCPCAAGYVCSKATETCLKLCSTAGAGAECGSGKCFGVATLPDGFGVCGLGSVGDAG